MTTDDILRVTFLIAFLLASIVDLAMSQDSYGGVA